MENSNEKKPNKWKNNWYVLRDCFIAMLVGILLGFIIDIIFPLPKKEHSVWFALLIIAIQIIIDGFVVYYFGEIYNYFFGQDADSYRGFTVFGVLFFIVQVQLLTRLNYLFQKITGRNFE